MHDAGTLIRVILDTAARGHVFEDELPKWQQRVLAAEARVAELEAELATYRREAEAEDMRPGTACEGQVP